LNRIVNAVGSNCYCACASRADSYTESQFGFDGHVGSMFTDVSLHTSLPAYQSISRYQQCTHTFILLPTREYLQYILSIINPGYFPTFCVTFQDGRNNRSVNVSFYVVTAPPTNIRLLVATL